MRVSYEGNTSVIMAEGLMRCVYYYNEANICTANTYPTISTLIQKDLMQRMYKKNEIKRKWL